VLTKFFPKRLISKHPIDVHDSWTRKNIILRYNSEKPQLAAS
jgi:hypothetical protein